MDKRLEYIAKNLDKMKRQPEDTFKFGCKRCGKCCKNRYDILLNPKDIYRAAKYLGETTVDFWNKYCNSYIGESSKVPIVRLMWLGKDDHCVFFNEDSGCLIHKVKPTVCAMYPLGRYIKANKYADPRNMTVDDIGFILQDTHCGESERHTVKGWLEHFNIPLKDEYWIKWNKFISLFSGYMRNNEKVLSDKHKGDLYNISLFFIYLNYDMNKDFEPQFDKNAEYVLKQIGQEW